MAFGLSFSAYPEESLECWRSWAGKHASRRLRQTIALCHVAAGVIAALVATRADWHPGGDGDLAWLFDGIAWGFAGAALLRLDFQGTFHTDRAQPALSALQQLIVGAEGRVKRRRVDPVVSRWARNRDDETLVRVAVGILERHVKRDPSIGWADVQEWRRPLKRYGRRLEKCEATSRPFRLGVDEREWLIGFVVTRIVDHRLTRELVPA